MDKPCSGMYNRDVIDRFWPLIWPLTVFWDSKIQISKNHEWSIEWSILNLNNHSVILTDDTKIPFTNVLRTVLKTIDPWFMKKIIVNDISIMYFKILISLRRKSAMSASDRSEYVFMYQGSMHLAKYYDLLVFLWTIISDTNFFITFFLNFDIIRKRFFS